MNTLLTNSRSRLAKSMMAGIGSAFLMLQGAAFAADTSQVAIKLQTKVFGDGKGFTATSGSETIVAAEAYTYELRARVVGDPGTPIGKLIPSKTTLDALVESLTPGSSKFLRDTVKNPSGTRPVTLLSKRFAGIKKIPGVGDVNISFKVLATIAEDGKCVMKVSQVKVKAASGADLGNITFMKGSKAVVEAKPAFTFLASSRSVREDAGEVQIPVLRNVNFRGDYSVFYSTIEGTATSADYTPVTNGKLDFGNTVTKQFITIPITNNGNVDGPRSFTVKLLSPTNDASLGAIEEITISIIDDE